MPSGKSTSRRRCSARRLRLSAWPKDAISWNTTSCTSIAACCSGVRATSTGEASTRRKTARPTCRYPWSQRWPGKRDGTWAAGVAVYILPRSLQVLRQKLHRPLPGGLGGLGVVLQPVDVLRFRGLVGERVLGVIAVELELHVGLAQL